MSATTASASTVTTQSTIGSNTKNATSGVWEAAQNFLNNAKKETSTYFSSSQKMKSASSVDSFYMYSCGSINMP